MPTRIRSIFICLLLVTLLSACNIDQRKQDQADQTLRGFFDLLAQGDYAAAADLYGGSYETLWTFNPELDPLDEVALWQNGCKVNGLHCLTIRTATFNELTSHGEYIFTVEFNHPDGTLFVQAACCGENPTMPPQFQFEYRVVETGIGFRVLDIPVYTP